MEQIDGSAIAEEVERELEFDVEPHLHIVFAGESKASEAFVTEKQEACERNSIRCTVERFPEDVSEQEVLKHIKELNSEDSVHGVLVQLPMPSQIDENRVFRTLEPEKDVDGLTPENMGRLLRGDETIVPCAVKAIERILEHEDIGVKGKNVTVINNSSLIGRPLSMVLTRRDATVTLCHEETQDLGEHARNADIIVTATGKPDVIEKEDIEDDTVVIDAGYNYIHGELAQETENLEEKASKISPVPGGVGPVTVAMTLKNLLNCHRIQN